MGNYYKDEHKYDDIINLPHHQSTERAHMSLHDRAAQFAPFAALTGHEEAIEETARVTDEKTTLDESTVAKINEILFDIAQHLSEKRPVTITYFVSDKQKSGGAYLTDVGTIKKIDEFEKTVLIDSGMLIPMGEIRNIEYVEMFEGLCMD